MVSEVRDEPGGQIRAGILAYVCRWITLMAMRFSIALLLFMLSTQMPVVLVMGALQLSTAAMWHIVPGQLKRCRRAPRGGS